MFPPLFPKGLKAPLTGLGLSFALAMPAFAAGDDAVLSEQSMTQAIGYLALLRGRDISAEDSAWLKQQWNEEFETSPQAVATEVDELALSFEHQNLGRDQLALANSRTALVKNTFCAAKQSSAPHLHRLMGILAPDGLVLAADCVLGLVVTRFDVDGLVASHALTAAATGQGHDAGSDGAEILNLIKDGFADALPTEKALIANGELRQAVLARFWSRIEGSPEQGAIIDEIRAAAGSDLRGAARQLENLALSKLGDVDYLARAGDARLTTAAVNSYNQWLERIAGYSIPVRDRAWLQTVIIDEFQKDPAKTLSEVAGVRDMNSAYARASGLVEKNDLVAGWAANLHCYLSASSDPDELRLAEVIFRQDPVVEADCQSGKVRRKSNQVLAEADGQILTERDIDISKRFASILFGRPLSPDEETIVRNDSIQSFKEDLKGWNEDHDFFTGFLSKVDSRRSSLFLAVDERKKLFDAIYCAIKKSDETYSDEYLEMFQRGGAILYEDCDRQLVTTRDEVDAIASFANFLTLVNERPPLSEGEREALVQSIKSQDLTKAEVSKSALDEWWSLLSFEEKAAEAERMRQQGITPEADSATINNFLNLIKIEIVGRHAQLQACKLAAVVSQGQTAIYAAKAARYGWNDPNSDIAGFPVDDYTTLVTNNGLFAEFCQ